MQGISTPALHAITCPQCGAVIAAEPLAAGAETVCPGCRARLEGRLFPAFDRPHALSVESGARALDGEALCFFHAEKAAVSACERCGRFICALCDVALGARHLCPTCLGQSLGGEKLPELITSRVCWSKLSLLLGVVPLLVSVAIWPVIVFSGAAAVGAAIYGWKKPGSLVSGRQPWAAIVGLLCGLLQIAMWGGFVLLLWWGRLNG